jgi:hypothetical protein
MIGRIQWMGEAKTGIKPMVEIECVGANLMFALEQKPVSNLWSRIYINRSPSGIGSIPVFVRGRT